jgi:hypothetical protein
MNKKLNLFIKKIVQYYLEYELFFEEEKHNKSNEEELNQFFIQISLNQIDVLRSVTCLFQNLEIRFCYLSLGLILRSAILDSLTSLYLIEIIEDKELPNSNEMVNEKIQEIISDQLNRAFKYMESLYGQKPKLERIAHYEAINLKYGRYLLEKLSIANSKATFKTKPKSIPPKKLASSGKYLELKEILHDSYVMYSQFEHTGILTKNFHEQIFVPETKGLSEERIVKELKIIVKVNQALLRFFEVENARIFNLRRIHKEIVKFNISAP